MRPRRRSKYHVDLSAAGKLARTVDGIVFHSAKEARAYRALKALEKAGQISQLRCQVPFPCVVKLTLICTLRMDFMYMDRDGRARFHEVKGVRTDVYAIKKRLVEVLYGITIEET